MRDSRFSKLVAAFAAIACGSTMFAVTITVDSLADTNDPQTLRWALNSAGNGDVIDFAPGILPGTITLTGPLPTITADLTIDGPGYTQLTIDGVNSYRCFNVDDGFGSLWTSKVSIDDITITNGTVAAENGAGIWCVEDLTLTRCVLSSNTAGSNGGAICMGANSSSDCDGTLMLDNCTIADNAAATGGAVYLDIYNNAGTYEGAGQLTVTTCEFDTNAAANYGGAIYAMGPDRHVYIEDSYLHGNTADNGGALATRAVNPNFATPLDIDGTTFAQNTAVTSGGAVFSDANGTSDGPIYMTNCTICNNEATNGSGGGVYHQLDWDATDPEWTMSSFTNCTVTDNTCAGATGGGLGNGGTGWFRITNCLLANNTSPDVNDGGHRPTGGGNYVEDTTGINVGGLTAPELPYPNPDPGMLGLADNGGIALLDGTIIPTNSPDPTRTYALGDGANQFLPSPGYNGSPATDQRGYWIDRPGGDPDLDNRTTGAYWCSASATPSRGFKASVL